MTVARVILRPKRAQPFFARHPWVFAGAIERVEGAFTDGDEVDLITHGDTFVARGLINDRSKIRVRLFSWNEGQSLDRAFFRSRLEAAIRLRYQMLNLDVPDGGCRLVASEGDGLSGCTVDRYGQWLVLQLTSLGLANRREMIAELLVELLQPKGIYLRTERGIGLQVDRVVAEQREHQSFPEYARAAEHAPYTDGAHGGQKLGHKLVEGVRRFGHDLLEVSQCRHPGKSAGCVRDPNFLQRLFRQAGSRGSVAASSGMTANYFCTCSSAIKPATPGDVHP